MAKTKVIKQPTYQGFTINTAHGGCKDSWLNKLINKSNQAIKQLQRPEGYVISFELGEGKEITQVFDALRYFYKRGMPIYLCKYEVKLLAANDPEYDKALDPHREYHHYHMAVILDGKWHTKKSISYFLHVQQKKGLIHQYHVSKDKVTKKVSKPLKTMMAEWIYHASYLCKIATTAKVAKPFTTSAN
jgi:hypothetical protein